MRVMLTLASRGRWMVSFISVALVHWLGEKESYMEALC